MTHRRMRGLSVAIAMTMLAVAPVQLAYAEPSSPTPVPPVSTPEPTPEVSASTTPSPSAPATPETTSPAPATPPTPPTKAPTTQAEPVTVTLVVSSTGGPVAGRFYQDLGSYGFSGQAAGLPDGAVVSIARKTPTTGYAVVVKTTVVGGAFAVKLPVTDAGSYTFRASTVISGDPDLVVTSPAVVITVADAGTRLDRPVSKIDSLLNPTITGLVFPARAGVKINIDVMRGSTPKTVAQTTTDAAGRFRVVLGYGRGELATYPVRSAYRAVNAPRWEKSSAFTVQRTAVLNARVTKTTAAEVAKTYRKGCPVGRSKLRTITMNFYGRDKRMHRGVIIIRTDLAPELIRGFGRALDHRYPLAKMNNPNAYGGNDPKQMKANNTSGFNCRKVVGNPYAQSPHSYGIALDVSPVQNPYRDRHGTWWPKNGKKYVNRSNKRWGMLTKNSYLTKSLRKDHFFWGGFWNPGRDYQHFEYRP